MLDTPSDYAEAYVIAMPVLLAIAASQGIPYQDRTDAAHEVFAAIIDKDFLSDHDNTFASFGTRVRTFARLAMRHLRGDLRVEPVEDIPEAPVSDTRFEEFEFGRFLGWLTEYLDESESALLLEYAATLMRGEQPTCRSVATSLGCSPVAVSRRRRKLAHSLEYVL